MFRTLKLLAPFGMIFTFAMSGASISNSNPFSAQPAHAGRWCTIKKKAKAGGKKTAKGFIDVSRKAKQIGNDQIKVANGHKVLLIKKLSKAWRSRSSVPLKLANANWTIE